MTKMCLKACVMALINGLVMVSFCCAREPIPAEWSPGARLEVAVLQVIDGDTIRVRGASGLVDVRLHGIDAPEWNQSCLSNTGETFLCGRTATEVLVGIIGAHSIACRSERMHGLCVTGGLPVSCNVLDLDRKWGRPVARCFAGRNDIGREMVSQGFAKAAYSDDYTALAATARLTRKGLWNGAFGDPATFRRDRTALYWDSRIG